MLNNLTTVIEVAVKMKSRTGARQQKKTASDINVMGKIWYTEKQQVKKLGGGKVANSNEVYRMKGNE
jgi:glycerol-3-phosphate cytidylyltransferase-like family protein